MKEELSEILLKDEGFFKNNHYQLEEARKDKIVLKAPITKESKNLYGICHGGFIFGLGDHAMGVLASINRRKSVTLNANINFISPGVGEYLLAEAEIIKRGKKTCILKTNIYNNDKNLVATMNSTYYYLEEEKEG